MRATILAMRLLIAAAFAALVVVVGGCGGTASTGSTADPALGSDAAQLVPPDALALASKFDQGSEHYTVQEIGGWSVVADSADAFAGVRSAQGGRSLGDTSAYSSAQSQVAGAATARLYVASGAFAQLAKQLGAAAD